MKRCPECRRDYYDESLLYCLDDGSGLLDGPASGDEPVTAIHSSTAAAENPTKRFDPKVERARASAANSLIAGVIGIILVSALGVGGYWLYSSRTSKQIDSIAVMPFMNASGNADLEYLSDGMTDSLINSLLQLPNLKVQSMSSVLRYKGKETDAPSIGRELSVQAILNGRVVQRGDGLTLYLELVDAVTANRIWGEQYDRKQTDLVTLQREVARDVASKLQAKLTSADQQKLAKNYTASPEAYRLYLQGRFFWNKRTPQNLQKAIGYFEQAIALDPNYALAYSGLADAHASGDSRSLEFARKALALDDSLAEAHTSLGTALLRDNYDFSGAENAYRRAIELNPSYATAHQFYGRMVDALGRHDEADVEFRRALELEPLSLPINWFYGIHLYVIRDYEASVRQLRKTVELDPSFVNGHGSLSDALVLSGKYSDAAEQLAKRLEVRGDPSGGAVIRKVCTGVSWQDCWRALTGENSPIDPQHFLFARMYAELGERDKAFAELERSYERREAPFLRLKVEPRLDNLRDDPRYTALVKRVGFPN